MKSRSSCAPVRSCALAALVNWVFRSSSTRKVKVASAMVGAHCVSMQLQCNTDRAGDHALRPAQVRVPHQRQQDAADGEEDEDRGHAEALALGPKGHRGEHERPEERHCLAREGIETE